MKNFKKDFLENEENFSHHVEPLSNIPIPESRCSRPLSPDSFAPLFLSLITSPMNVGSISLQLLDTTSSLPIEQKLKAQPSNAKYISSGLFGDNVIFQPQPVKGYVNVFERIGKEGLRGFYKGNFTGFLFLTSNASLRSTLFNEVASNKDMGEAVQGLATIFVCTLVDVVTYPLMTAQSRLVLQNSNPSFRTYSSFVDVLRRTPVTELFKGTTLTLPKNILMWASWFNFLDLNPMYSFVVSSVLTHVTTYPVTTLIRRMQVQSDAPMMYSRKLSIGQTLKEMWSRKGIRAFYQGFVAYGIVHGFTLGLMMSMNQRSGYFVRE